MREDSILVELEQARADIRARFEGDFDAYVDYLQALVAENRRRGLPYSDDVEQRHAGSPTPVESGL